MRVGRAAFFLAVASGPGVVCRVGLVRFGWTCGVPSLWATSSTVLGRERARFVHVLHGVRARPEKGAAVVLCPAACAYLYVLCVCVPWLCGG